MFKVHAKAENRMAFTLLKLLFNVWSLNLIKPQLIIKKDFFLSCKIDEITIDNRFSKITRPETSCGLQIVTQKMKQLLGYKTNKHC